MQLKFLFLIIYNLILFSKVKGENFELSKLKINDTISIKVIYFGCNITFQESIELIKLDSNNYLLNTYNGGVTFSDTCSNSNVRHFLVPKVLIDSNDIILNTPYESDNNAQQIFRKLKNKKYLSKETYRLYILPCYIKSNSCTVQNFNILSLEYFVNRLVRQLPLCESNLQSAGLISYVSVTKNRKEIIYKRIEGCLFSLKDFITWYNFEKY